MNLFLIFLGAAAFGILFVGFKATKATNHKVLQKTGRLTLASRAVSMLVLVAQATELVRVVEHASIVTVTAALLLLAVIVASKSGTNSELH
jgi:hypothetical protein